MAGRQPSFAGHEPVRAQVLVGGRVQLDQALLPKLHHRYRGEGLRDGADPKDRVLGHWSSRPGVRDAVTGEPERSPANYTDRQTNSRPAIQNRIDLGIYFMLIDLWHGLSFDSN